MVGTTRAQRAQMALDALMTCETKEQVAAEVTASLAIGVSVNMMLDHILSKPTKAVAGLEALMMYVVTQEPRLKRPLLSALIEADGKNMRAVSKLGLLERFIDLVISPKELALLFKWHRSGKITPNNPLFCESGGLADRFWSLQIVDQISEWSFRKAWVTLNKARLGARINVNLLGTPYRHCFKASWGTLDKLVTHLFRSMCQLDLISLPPELDMRIPPAQMRAPDRAPTSLRQIGKRRAPKMVRRPGFDFAMLFASRETPGTLEFSGAVTLLMAAYFERMEYEKRSDRFNGFMGALSASYHHPELPS